MRFKLIIKHYLFVTLVTIFSASTFMLVNYLHFLKNDGLAKAVLFVVFFYLLITILINDVLLFIVIVIPNNDRRQNTYVSAILLFIIMIRTIGAFFLEKEGEMLIGDQAVLFGYILQL
jgi:hypothetical protein